MSIEFTINGKAYKFRNKEYPADLTLNTFIREKAKLFGTKFFCNEGGCGVCTVVVRNHHPVTNVYQTRAVNSCLTLLNICHDWDIVTIEGLGNRKDGYHPIQERLAEMNGSQCGFCSPGMVMNMYGLLESSNGNVSADTVENSFGGNICRCTGYRPILDAMKSFATQVECDMSELRQDIEDLRICQKVGKVCDRKCQIAKTLTASDLRTWHHPNSLVDIYAIFGNIGNSPYMLVAGGTAHGVYPRDPHIQNFIDVNHVAELRSFHHVDETIELGGNLTLAEMMDVMAEASNTVGFEYLKETLTHLDLVASVQIRNIGTIAGNLMIKHDHPEFISDIFVILQTIRAQMEIGSAESHDIISLSTFLGYDMHQKVIVKIILRQWDRSSTVYGAYKILPRAQHSHAHISAGFLFTVVDSRVTNARIIFNGIAAHFNKAQATTAFYKTRKLFDSKTFQQALTLLEAELNPDWILPAPSAKYRELLALGLFYKFILRHAPPDSISRKFQSGGELLERPLSSGSQYFDSRSDRWPVNKPVLKLEAKWQTSGEAMYCNDLPYMRGEVWAEFVVATRVQSIVASIDATEALAIPGVVAFYSAKDIPRKNTFVAVGIFGIVEDEELFCSGVVKYHSQPVGIILAKSYQLAQYAAKKVQILYTNQLIGRSLKPTIVGQEKVEKVEHLDEGVESDDDFVFVEGDLDGDDDDDDKPKRVRGHLEMGGQFHFALESHVTVCIPKDDGLLLYASVQNIDLLQAGITEALGLPEHRVDVRVPRLGGSYGAKLTRGTYVGVASALASWLSNRPVRFVQSLESKMRVMGKRFACVSDYNARVDQRGKVRSMQIDFFEDLGCSLNESPVELFTIPSVPNCYVQRKPWVVNGTPVRTDAPSHTWCRAPGVLEGTAMAETIMEHIARVVKSDPVDVRLANIASGSEMAKLLPEFIKKTDYRARKKAINKFNKANRWRKRGIAISLMRYPIAYVQNMAAAVAIFHYDGTVAISHGGIEMGQGLNTKAAQVAAYTFGIPLEMVSVKTTNSFDGANSIVTGGSIGSETVCYAVRKACEVLLERMKPIRDQLGGNPAWLVLVHAAFAANVNLVAREIEKAGDMQGYDIFGLACSEIEVDILTGKSQLTRVDIDEDTGISLSQLIDVGQVEGAFVMGLGYWLFEKLVYDRQTGELKTHDTWDYKVPGAKDIPIDFRITLVQKKPNRGGFMGSKAVGEMGVCLSISALFALRHALDSARADAGLRDEWYQLGAPTTIEEVLLAAGHSYADFKFKD